MHPYRLLVVEALLVVVCLQGALVSACVASLVHARHEGLEEGIASPASAPHTKAVHHRIYQESV